MHDPSGYSQAGRMAYLAGQCLLDISGTLVGRGDFAAQTDQVIANSLAVLAAAGTSTDSAELVGVWGRLTASALGPAFTSASTLLGVAALGYRRKLIEVDLTAALG